MYYVVGFWGNDYTLGRTFMAVDISDAWSKLQYLIESNEDNDLIEDIQEKFDGGYNEFEGTTGWYFVGGLEEWTNQK